MRLYSNSKNAKGKKIDRDGIDRIFASTESGKCPWDPAFETVYDNSKKFDAVEKEKPGEGITSESWVGLWIKYFNLDTMAAFKDLVSIGYCGQLKDAVVLHNFKHADANGVSKIRNSFNCLVVSPSPEQTSRFMDAFVKSESRPVLPDASKRSVVRSYREQTSPDKEKCYWIIMREAGTQSIDALFSE